LVQQGFESKDKLAIGNLLEIWEDYVYGHVAGGGVGL
jgi:hypothetical protein